jgi:hypothetical protein
MKKPVFDSIDRYLMNTPTWNRYLMNTPTWIGRALRRELKFMRIKRKLFRL